MGVHISSGPNQSILLIWSLKMLTSKLHGTLNDDCTASLGLDEEATFVNLRVSGKTRAGDWLGQE